jgi:hypothetical protein
MCRPESNEHGREFNPQRLGLRHSMVKEYLTRNRLEMHECKDGRPGCYRVQHSSDAEAGERPLDPEATTNEPATGRHSPRSLDLQVQYVVVRGSERLPTEHPHSAEQFQSLGNQTVQVRPLQSSAGSRTRQAHRAPHFGADRVREESSAPSALRPSVYISRSLTIGVSGPFGYGARPRRSAGGARSGRGGQQPSALRPAADPAARIDRHVGPSTWR